jgi:hypothetical protein
VIVDGGGVLTAAAATTAPLTVDASQLALGMDAAAASPSFAAPPDAAATGPEARLAAARAVDSDGADAAARPTGKPAANAALDASRVAGPRPAAQKKTLQARQLEARTTGARTGNLHLLVTPWAVCWVDGEKIDQTPCMLDGLPVGHYRVRLENSRVHKDETLTATVTAGETTTIERIW